MFPGIRSSRTELDRASILEVTAVLRTLLLNGTSFDFFQQEKSETELPELPSIVWGEIMSHLNFHTLKNMKLVNRKMYQTANMYYRKMPRKFVRAIYIGTETNPNCVNVVTVSGSKFEKVLDSTARELWNFKAETVVIARNENILQRMNVQWLKGTKKVVFSIDSEMMLELVPRLCQFAKSVTVLLLKPEFAYNLEDFRSMKNLNTIELVTTKQIIKGAELSHLEEIARRNVKEPYCFSMFFFNGLSLCYKISSDVFEIIKPLMMMKENNQKISVFNFSICLVCDFNRLPISTVAKSNERLNVGRINEDTFLIVSDFHTQTVSDEDIYDLILKVSDDVAHWKYKLKVEQREQESLRRRRRNYNRSHGLHFNHGRRHY